MLAGMTLIAQFFCSTIDSTNEFSFEHMLEFSKLAVAYVVELGGWSETVGLQ